MVAVHKCPSTLGGALSESRNTKVETGQDVNMPPPKITHQMLEAGKSVMHPKSGAIAANLAMHVGRAMLTETYHIHFK